MLSVIFLAAAYALFVVIRRTDWIGSRPVSQAIHQSTYERKEPAFVWSEAEIKSHLSKIDWYQFEKFCATILEAEGFEVERKGGASPDGGVDLVARKNQTRTLIQCKHWQTWKVREPVIRQLLGSMVDFDVSKGAVFFSGESTEPAKDFAAKHGIGLVDGYQLAERALKALSENSLNSILKCEVHHCPKCESEMVWRTGDFKPFWGCSRFPKCRGVLKHSGPR
ncbi:MAG: restriction endonuclease [Opitutales bacterium]